MTSRSRIHLIMDIIGRKHSEFFTLELGKIGKLDFVYSLASTNINQSTGTKLDKNEYDHEISNELDYGSNWTRTV